MSKRIDLSDNLDKIACDLSDALTDGYGLLSDSEARVLSEAEERIRAIVDRLNTSSDE